MLYAFHLMDNPGVGELRLKVRPEHKQYLAEVADRMAFAGPLFGEDGKTMVGSLLVIDFPSLQAARAWQSNEPFTKAGVYGESRIHAFANLWPQKVGFPEAA